MRGWHHHKFDMGQHHGWGGHRGGWFFPPFAVFLSIFLFVAIVKTGLWLPLLLIGLFMWGVPVMRRCQADGWPRDWSPEKWKRDWDVQPYAGEKPKRASETEKPKNDDFV
jgi:hypothetical protein